LSFRPNRSGLYGPPHLENRRKLLHSWHLQFSGVY
jgi:hypothetical protein